MKKLLAFASLIVVGSIVYAGVAGTNLVPPTVSDQIVQDTNGNMVFVDASTGPVTLGGLVAPKQSESNFKVNGVLTVTGTTVLQSSATLQGTLALTQSFTIAQLVLLTPSTTNQMTICSDCSYTRLVISSGIAQGAWIGVVQSTGNSSGFIKAQ